MKRPIPRKKNDVSATFTKAAKPRPVRVALQHKLMFEPLEARVLMSTTQALESAAARTLAAGGAGGQQQHSKLSESIAQPIRNIVAIDASLAAQGLTPANISADTRVIYLQPGTDPLAQITAALAGIRGVKSIQIFTHGASGQLDVGPDGSAAVIDAQTLVSDSAELAAWNKSLAPDAVIAIYGCDVAAGKGGQAFVKALARRTGATVAANTAATGAASLGGTWTLDYTAGKSEKIPAPDIDENFDGLLGAVTLAPGAGSTSYVIGQAATAVDPGFSASTGTPSLTLSSATVQVASSFYGGEDVLALPATAGYSSSYSSGTLTITASPAESVANWQSVLRTVTYQDSATSDPHLDIREITFTLDSITSAGKTVTPVLPVDSAMQSQIVSALNVVAGIGTAIDALGGTPLSGNTTAVPYSSSTIAGLLYPSTLSTSVQPTEIGAYLQLSGAASTYFASAGTITNLSGLAAALTTELQSLVPGTNPLLNVSTTFTEPADSDNRSLSLIVTIANSKGAAQTLDLSPLQTDLGITFPGGPTVTVGGGADIQFTISLNLQGHTYGGALPASDVTLNFNRLSAFAGLAFGLPANTAINVGALGGTTTGGSGILGADIPVVLSSNDKTLDNWSTTGTEVSSFATSPTSVATITLPIAASIGGTPVTTANTSVVVSDPTFLGGGNFQYTTTDFGPLKYFATITPQQIIQQVQQVGSLYSALDSSDASLLGVSVPLITDVTLGDLADFSDLFNNAVGTPIGVTQPILNTNGTQLLTGDNLPIASGSSSIYSDLWSEFQFGVQVNGSETVTSITVAADNTRNTLDGLVAALNTAFTTAGVDIAASNDSGKLSFTSSDLASVQSFNLVPVAPTGDEAGELSPAAPPSDLSSIPLNTPEYYTVTGTTAGTVTGTTYYDISTPIAAAAVHAGILAAGQTGTVEVVRVGATGELAGSTLNGITSAGEDSSSDAYVVTYADDLSRLGVGTGGGLLESTVSNTVTASLPIQAVLTGNAALSIGDGSTDYAVTIAANSGNTDITQTLTEVQSALTTAGIASDVAAQLVDGQGNVLAGAPASGTNYYLQFYLPTGSAWTTLAVSPTSAVQAYAVLPLGFLVGDQSTAQLPANLQTFQDFQNPALFPNLSITPVYDATNDTVTLDFAASNTTTPDETPDFTFSISPLGQLQVSGSPTFSPTVTSSISFGVQFDIGPAAPVQLIGSTDLPTNGQLTADSTFTLGYALGDTYSVTVPHAWTTSNTSQQDLVSDINLALSQASDTTTSTADTDLTGGLIAQLGGDGNDLVLTNATPVGTEATVTQTAGVLASDLSLSFTYQSIDYTLALPASATAGNTNFGQLVAQLNSALNSCATSAGSTVSLSNDLFFTTIAGTNGAAATGVQLYTTSPTGATWPTSISLTADRTDPMVATLGFSDGGTAATSTVSAQASGVNAVVVSNGSDPLASVSVQMATPSAAGSVPYGFSTIDFGTSSGTLDAVASVALSSQTQSINTVASAPDSYLTRTLTNSSGSGTADASFTLGTLSSSGATIAPSSTITIDIPDISAADVQEFVPLGQPIPIPDVTGGVLSSDQTVNFLDGATLVSVTVTAASTTSNTTFTQLATQFDNALTAATESISGGTPIAANASSLFQIAPDSTGTQLQVSALSTVSNPNFATVAFLPGLSSFGSLAYQGAFGPAAVATGLQDVLPIFTNLQASSPLLSQFNLPLINTPLNQLININGSLLNEISTFNNATVSSEAGIAPALASALNIPADQVSVTYDSANDAYRIDLQYQTAVVTTKPLDITLADFYEFTNQTEPAGLERLVDTGDSSPLSVNITATVNIALGIDLTNPNAPRPFLYGYDGSGNYGVGDGTSIQLAIQASANNINFTAATGSMGVYVEGGEASIGGPPETGDNGQPVYTYNSDPNELSLVQSSNAALLSFGLQGQGDGVSSTTDASAEKFYIDGNAAADGDLDGTDTGNYQTSFTGSVEANLPLFTPTQFDNPFTNLAGESVNILSDSTVTNQTITPGGNVFNLQILNLGAFAADSLQYNNLQRQINTIYTASNGSPSGGQQSQIAALQSQQAAVAANGDVTIYTPDVSAANSSAAVPTLVDALQDPSLLVDGIQTVLGGVGTALQQLDDLDIPVIGPVLGDAVKDVFSWDDGWLADLKAELRNAGANVFSELQNEIFSYLGPSGLNILLENNGESGVNSIIPAQSPDDVGIEFLDSSGNVMTGNTNGADAVQFDIQLGSLLVNTGANLSFNFNDLSPALSLAISGGLTFKLGWEASLGFGYSLKDGFYVVTNSAPGVNQMELQFAAGLSGAESSYTIVADGNGDGGYQIDDSSGDPVQGPTVSGEQDLNVIEVDDDGNPTTGDNFVAPSSSSSWGSSSTTTTSSQTYWVVAINGVPAEMNDLGQYVAQTESNGSYDPNSEILYNQTAPFSALGSLFYFNLQAVDQQQIGINAPTDADYYFTTDDTVTAAGRDDPSTGVNRNNDLPTVFSGTIGIKLVDPSAAASNYVARPGISPTGFILMDGSNDLGGNPVLDSDGNTIPVMESGGTWYYAELSGDTYVIGDPITTDESPNRITFQEMEDAGASIFELDLTAQAVVNLNMTLSIGDSAAIPKLTASLNLDWQYQKTFGGPDAESSDGGDEGDAPQTTSDKLALLPAIGINNVRLDLGSFLSEFIKPIADEINSAMAPIDPLLQDLETAIPIISSIAGHPVTLTTLLADFGGGDGEALATFIDLATDVGQLSSIIAGLPADADAYIPIGNFWLADVSAGPFGQPGEGEQIYYDNSQLQSLSILQRNQSLIADPGAGATALTNALGSVENLEAGNGAADDGSTGGGFDFPILDNPMTIFGLLMGQTESLVTFSLPKLNFDFSQDIPLIKIVCFEVGIDINVDITGQLDIGYDTYGLQEYEQNHDPADILDGFYISTRENADGTGAPADALDIHASIGLYGGIDVVLAKAGIEGGFEFNGSIAWNDPNNDGKLRLPEMIDLVENNDDPLDLADISLEGDVYARYYYWVGIDAGFFTITLYQGGDTFAQIPLFDLTRDGQDGPPVYATMGNATNPDGTTVANTLSLNMGPTADLRVSNEDPLNATDDGAENFKVWNNIADPSTVYVQYLNYSSTYTETYTGVSEVTGIAGPAGDSIDASGLNGIPVDFTGDEGNDTFELGSGSTSTISTIDAGAGDNLISVTGGGNVTIDADGSNDTITTGSGSTADDTVAVSSGNNTITAGGNGANNTLDFNGEFGTNNLTLSPSATANVLDFTNSAQAITANLSGASSTIAAGSANKVTFNLADATLIRGTQGDDTFNVTDPTTENANNGDGLIIQGGPGDENYDITADDTSGIASDGITIEGEAPTSLATVGTPTLCEPDGYIMSIPITDGGAGYAVPPTVVIDDPDGSGARAVASLNSAGTVTGIYVINGGSGYTTNATVTLVEPTPVDNKLTYTSNTTGTVNLDENGNAGAAYELSNGSGGPIKWVGTATPGQVRSADYDVDEIDDVTINLPTGNLALNSFLDLEGDLTVTGFAATQNAPIDANDVSITTDEGFAADDDINTIDNGDITIVSTGLLAGDNVPATATATVVGGTITGFTITNPGAGYLFPPTITIDDPNGTGALAVGEISGGELTGIVLVTGGSGYLTAPAPAVDIAPPSSIQLNANLTSSTVGSAPGTGDGRGTVNLRANLGAIDQTGDVAFPTGSNIAWNQGDFVYQSNQTLGDITTAQYPQTSVGSGAAAQAVIDSDGRVVGINVTDGGSGYSQSLLPTVAIDGGATATAIVGDDGSITGFHITYPGSGYAVAPSIAIVPNGFGYIVGDDDTTQSTDLNRDRIDSQGGSLVAVAYDGIGDPSKPLKTDVSNMVGQTFALAAGIHVLQNNSMTIGEDQNIDGLNTVNGDISVTTFGGTLGLGSPEQLTNASGQLLWQDANKTVPIYATDDAGNIIYQGGNIASGDGQVKLTADRIQVNNYLDADGGQLILQPVNPDAPIGLPGTQATAAANITDGQVASLTPDLPGVAYSSSSPPLVIVTPPGQRAFATATVGDGEVQSIQLTYGGTNYNADALPIVTLVGGGADGATPANPATVTAAYDPTSGQVTAFTITNSGSGYESAPTVNISLPGTQATATAVVTDGKVTGYTIVNPGSNYQVAPGVTVDPPFPFTLDQQEVQYFNTGFSSVIIGRADGQSPFYAPDTSIDEPLELRSPLGGDMQVNDLEVEAPLNIVGSGQGMELTQSSPTVTGTSVNINNNVIVDDATDGLIQATGGDVDITGSGVGNIDGAAGSTTADLTLEATGNVLVGGAIGSNVPLDNLTITSNGVTPGNVTIQGNVTLTGDLTITAGQNITFGGNVSIGGDLIIDQGASVSFNGTVTTAGHLLISSASTVSFAQNVAVADSFTVGQSDNVDAVESLTLSSNARLDAGEVAVYTTDDITFGNRIGQSSPPAFITLDSAEGDVNFAGAVTATNTIDIINADNVTFANNLTAPGLIIQLATGEISFERAATLGSMNITSANLVETLNQLTLTTSDGTITANTISFQGGSGSISYTGSGSSTLTIKPYTTTEAVRVGSPPGAAIGLDISDVDLDAIGTGFARVNLGDSAAGTGSVTIGSIGSQEGAGNSQLLNPTSIFGGSIDVVQNVDSAAGAGDLTLVAATGNIDIDAALNSVAAERSALVSLTALVGQVIINAPVYASSQVGITAATGTSETSTGLISTPTLAVSTVSGPVSLANSGNSLAVVAIDAGNNAITLRNDNPMSIGTVDGISGLSSGTANTSITDNGGAVTQTQPISAAGLELLGTGSYTLTNADNAIGTLAADPASITLFDSASLTVGAVNSTTGILTAGNLDLTTAGAMFVNEPIATTNSGTVTLAAQNGNLQTTAAIDSAAAASLTALADLDAGASIQAGAALTLTAQIGSVTADALTAAGPIALTANINVNLLDPVSTTVGGVSITATNGTVSESDDASITAPGDVSITSGLDITGGGAIGAASATLIAGGNLTLDSSAVISTPGAVILTATAGNLSDAASGGATGAIAVSAPDGTVAVAGLDASIGSITVSGASTVNVNGPVSSGAGGVSVTAPLDLLIADAASVLAPAGDITLSAGRDLTGGGAIGAGGTVTMTAGRDLTADSAETVTAAGDISLTTTTGTLAAAALIDSTAGAVAIEAQESTASAGEIEADEDVQITGATGVSLTGPITSTAGSVTAAATADDMTVSDAATISAGTDVTLTAAGDLIGGGPIAAVGTVTLSAGNNLTGDAADSIEGGAGVSLTAAQNLAQTGAVQSDAGAVSVQSQNGTVSVASLSGDTGVSITGNGGTTLTAPVSSSAGAIAITEDSGEITIADAATITAADAVTLTSPLSITAGGAINAASLSVSAVVNYTGDSHNTITTTGDVTFLVDGATAEAAPIHGTDGGITIITGTATVAAIDAQGQVAINATNSAHLTGPIASDAAGVSIDAFDAGLSIAAAATIHAAGDVSLTAGQNLTDSAAVTSTAGTVSMTSNASTVSAAAVSGADGVTIAGDVNVNLSAPVAASAGDVIVTTQADDIVLSEAAPIAASGNVNLTAARDLIGGGAIAAGGAADLAAGRNLTFDTAATVAAGSADLTAAASLSDAAPIQTTGPIAMDAQGGALTLSATGFLSAGGNITLASATRIDTAANATSSAGAVDYASSVDLTGSIAVTGNAGITFASTVNGHQTLSLTGGAIAMNGAVGNTAPLAAVFIPAAASFSAASIAAGQVSESATGATTVGPITVTAGQGVSLNSTASLTVTGPIAASTGPVSLDSDALAVDSHIASAGAMSLTGTQTLVLGGGSLLAAGRGAPIAITSDDPILGGAADTITGNSTLLIQPATAATDMTIGPAAAGFDLTDAQLASIAPGFAHLTIGGAASNGAVSVGSANFTSPVTIASPAADGPVTIAGTLSTSGTGDSITVDSGGNLTVDGTSNAVADVDLVADFDGNGVGSVVIADGAPTTVESQTGNLTITGDNVYVGSDNYAATLSAPQGSLDIEDSTPRIQQVGAAPGQTVESSNSTGAIDINNPNTTLNVSGNVDIGASGSQPAPQRVNVQGNIVAGGGLSVESVSDADFYQFRVRTGQTIDVLGGGTVNTNNGSFLSTGGTVNLLGGSTGSSVSQNSTVISQASALPLDIASYGKKIADTLRAGDTGKAYVRITNTGSTDAVGSATVVAYATPNGGLAADQSAIGQTTLNVKLKPGQSKIVPVHITIPASLAVGSYQIALEQIPYHGTVTPTADGQLQITDPNVANVGSITVAIPAYTGTVAISMPKHKPAKATVTLTNTSIVKSAGSATIAIYASSNGSLTGATLLDTINASAAINPGKSKKYTARFALPVGLLPSQSYQLLAVVHPIPSTTNYAAPDTQLAGSFFSAPAAIVSAAA